MNGTLEQDIDESPQFTSVLVSAEPGHTSDGVDTYCAELRESMSCVTEPARLGSSVGAATHLDPLVFAVNEHSTAVWPCSTIDACQGQVNSAGALQGLQTMPKVARPPHSYACLAYRADGSTRDVVPEVTSPSQVASTQPFSGQDAFVSSPSRFSSMAPVVEFDQGNLHSLEALYAFRSSYVQDPCPSGSLVSSVSLGPNAQVDAGHRRVVDCSNPFPCQASTQRNAEFLASRTRHSVEYTCVPQDIAHEAVPECISERPTSVYQRGNPQIVTTKSNRCGDGRSANLSVSKQRRRYNQPRSSKYCHLCARHERAVEMVACGNLFRGLCQKSVCRKCFTVYNMDWHTAKSSFDRLTGSTRARNDEATTDSGDGSRGVSVEGQSGVEGARVWQCPHCVGTCPKRAKCFAYDRQTVRRRAKTQEARLRASSPAIGLSS